jgi:hypothetical protein
MQQLPQAAAFDFVTIPIESHAKRFRRGMVAAEVFPF